MSKLELVKEILNRIDHSGLKRPFISNGCLIVCGNRKQFGKQNMNALLEAFECMGLKDCFAQSEQYNEMGVYAIFVDFDAIARADEAQ